MVKYETPPGEPSFFSVKHSCTIGGTQYRPSICYPVPESLRSTVKKLAVEGLAKLYTEEMRFVSGVARRIPYQG